MMSRESVPQAQTSSSDETASERRLEELLLEGLDHYFAARYEDAITVWTRVAFLERGHGRARAYVERARRAQAERQRLAEELVHAGVSAYHAGEVDAARDLLTRAIDEGGPQETALTYLQRLERTDAARVSVDAAVRGRLRPRSDLPAVPLDVPVSWFRTIAASVTVAAAIAGVSVPVRSWVGARLATPATAPAASGRRPLPVVGEAARVLPRARRLAEQGQSRDALALLARITPDQPERAEADALVAAIQRALLAPAQSESRVP